MTKKKVNNIYVMNNKNKVALHTLGCKVNSYETEAIEQDLINAGFQIVPFDTIADIYIINTCTVTAIADKKSRQMIRRAKNKNEDAIIVACGCYVEKNAEIVRDDCHIIIGNNKKSNVVAAINEYINKNEKLSISDDLFSKDTAFEKMMLNTSLEKTRAFIKVQDGCNAYCAYCMIPYVRGVSRSRRVEDILNEVEAVSKNGHSEIVLCAINLSDYNYEGHGLDELVKRINEIDSVSRIRLGSLEPDIFTKNFVEKLSKCKKLCPHFHLSLQSACDKTLKNMRRRYTTNAFFDACNNLRESFDNPAICADVIAGFPMETDDDFEETYRNIKSMGLFELHVFPYSEREGTKAATMDGRLDKKTKTDRAARLIELSKEMSNSYRKSLIGKTVKVLFEEKQEIEDKTYWVGFCGEYVHCAFDSKENLKGLELQVKIISELNIDTMQVGCNSLKKN